jgi:pimeloyl-ACP methyl ester carboxylesterase
VLHGKESTLTQLVGGEVEVRPFRIDVPEEELADLRRRIAEPAWKKLPSWAVVSSGDKAAGSDVVRSMAERVGATTTEVEGSHVIMMSQPQVVADVILSALAAAPQ